MFHRFRGIGAGIVLAAAAGAPAMAGVPSAGNPPPGYGTVLLTDPIPPGSYQKSCISITAKGTALYAYCSDSQGKYQSTSLANYNAYPGQDIANCNGVLTIGRCPSAHH